MVLVQRMKQSKDPFEAALEESPGDSPDELEIETQPQTGTAAGSATAAVTGELEDEFDNLESQAPMSVSADPAAKMTMSKNKDEYDEEDDENVDVELGKFPSSSDPAKMAKMQAILNQFTEDQMNRYESFRRSALQKSNMRRVFIASLNSLNLVRLFMFSVTLLYWLHFSCFVKAVVGEHHREPENFFTNDNCGLWDC